MAEEVLKQAQIKRNYHTLDGLRAVAAVAVMSRHYGTFFAPIALPSSYLAVDLFFLMSGFVIAHAYEAKIENGLSTRRFIYLRVARLYPLYILGSGIGLAWAVTEIVSRKAAHLVWGRLFSVLVPALFMVPTPATVLAADPLLFPLNFPAWSLFLELIANALYVSLFARLRGWDLGKLLMVSAMVLALTSIGHRSLEPGWLWPGAWVGLVRVIFSFFLGVALYRVHRADMLPRLKVPPAFLLLMAILIFAVPGTGIWRAAYDFCCVAFLFPALLCMAVTNEPRRHARTYALLGLISYPLYAIHAPLLLVIQRFDRVALHGALVRSSPYSGFALVFAVGALAWLLTATYDVPARRFLQRLVDGRTSRGNAVPTRVQ